MGHSLSSSRRMFPSETLRCGLVSGKLCIIHLNSNIVRFRVHLLIRSAIVTVALWEKLTIDTVIVHH